MVEPNPDNWALTHMRWLALSRWDNEGGASAFRPTAGLNEPAHPRWRNKGPCASTVRVHTIAVVQRRRNAMVEPAERAGPARDRPG